MTRRSKLNNIELNAINTAARKKLPALAKKWLPDGKLDGRFWVASNPHRPGVPASLQIDLTWGKWADYAVGKHGDGAISLAAYLARMDRNSAAIRLANMLGVE